MSKEDYQRWRDCKHVFNTALYVEGDTRRAMANASDMVVLSEWFACALRHRAATSAEGSLLEPGVCVPCSIAFETLEAVVAALYEGAIELGPDNLEPVLRLADAMQIPSLQEACITYAADSIAEGDAAWAAGVHALATTLSMQQLAAKALQQLVVKAASDASCLPALAHALQGLGGPQEQLQALREGISSRCGAEWPESFLVVLLLRLDQLAGPCSAACCVSAVPAAGPGPTAADSSGANGSRRSSIDSRGAAEYAAMHAAQAAGPDVAALLEQVDFQRLGAKEWHPLTLQALSCERDTPALRALTRRLLRHAAEQLYPAGPSSSGEQGGEPAQTVCSLQLDLGDAKRFAPEDAGDTEAAVAGVATPAESDAEDEEPEALQRFDQVLDRLAIGGLAAAGLAELGLGQAPGVGGGGGHQIALHRVEVVGVPRYDGYGLRYDQ